MEAHREPLIEDSSLKRAPLNFHVNLEECTLFLVSWTLMGSSMHSVVHSSGCGKLTESCQESR